jgi:glutamate-1-semialdehyde aminotransferase
MTQILSAAHLWERALELVPGGTHTISKRVTTFLDAESFPPFCARGRGAYAYDVEGRRYVDYISALGAVLLGYADERVDGRVRAQLADGFLFSLPHPCEVELAGLLVDVVPCAEQVRLFKTGAEATSAAVRTARIATGRELILCCGYHGWHDWWAVLRTPEGIPVGQQRLVVEFPFNDLDAVYRLVEQRGRETAAIMLTPAAYGVEPAPGFLEGVRLAANRLGVPLIFDEIITGFRWATGGAQERFGVVPDLACIGKAMANGMPISALVGTRALMEPMKDNWISSTYASDALSIVAALETIGILKDGRIHAQLFAQAGRLNRSLAELARAAGLEIATGAVAPAIRFDFLGSPDIQAARVRRFVGACARRGVLVRRDGTGVSLCLMAALTDADIDFSLNVFNTAFHEAV